MRRPLFVTAALFAGLAAYASAGPPEVDRKSQVEEIVRVLEAEGRQAALTGEPAPPQALSSWPPRRQGRDARFASGGQKLLNEGL